MIDIDASDLAQIARAMGRLPGEIKAKVFARAMRRVSETARTRVVRRQAPRLDLSQKVIREKTTARFNAGGHTAEVVVRSGWIPLFKLGATQTSRGVRVRLRGSYRHAFIAKMDSGHTGVFRRVPGTKMVDKDKEQIRELFGPNPAHDITNNQDVYIAVMAEVLEEVLAPRVMHELGRLLPR
ncbi:hypothetical protein [Aquibium oceanicum]|nr:hypothetical protein [Aquibium oceanicum]